jgi:hypothetical protein
VCALDLVPVFQFFVPVRRQPRLRIQAHLITNRLRRCARGCPACGCPGSELCAMSLRCVAARRRVGRNALVRWRGPAGNVAMTCSNGEPQHEVTIPRYLCDVAEPNGAPLSARRDVHQTLGCLQHQLNREREEGHASACAHISKVARTASAASLCRNCCAGGGNSRVQYVITLWASAS